MKNLFENFRKFVNEEASPEGIENQIVNVLKDEGGAAGMDPIKKAVEDLDLPEDFDLKDFLKGLKNVGQHEDGDYILGDDKEIHINKEDLEEGIEIFLEAQDDFLEEKRRSKRGKGRKKKRRKKKKGKKDACYHKVRARYDVWPSAYASGALVKCRKVGAANWGTGGKKKRKNESLENKSESLALEGKHPYSYTKDGYTYTFNPGTKRKMTDEEYAKAADRFEYDTYRHLVATGVIKPKSLETKPDRGVKIKPLKGGREKVKPKKAYVHDPASIKLGNKVYGTKNDPNFIPKFAQDREVHIKPELRNEELTLEEIILEELENVLSEKCWPGYEKKGMKTMFGKRYPNCVKKTKKKGKRRKKRKNEEIEEQYEIAEDVFEESELEEKKRKKKKTDFSKEKKSGLHGWFSRRGGKGKSKGWVDCNTCRKGKGGRKTCKTCGRQKGEKRAKYPHCRPTPSDCGTSKRSGKKSRAGKKG